MQGRSNDNFITLLINKNVTRPLLKLKFRSQTAYKLRKLLYLIEITWKNISISKGNKLNEMIWEFLE